MFELKDSKEIGSYLSKLIKSKGYKSDRQFCKAYLEHENKEVNDDEIRKMANRISQMLRGTKGKSIQVYDLPVFCDLLDVTCEELLSAGTSFVQKGSRITNYSMAFSNDVTDWEAYINREDKIILNPDEYGKTVLDYAIEFKNYKLIKYLIEKEYIWFDSRKKETYCMTFGAGTSIERRNPLDIDSFLQYTRLQDDQLRMDVIALAVNNNDLQILDELRAREIPELYYKVNFSNCSKLDIYENYNEEMVEQIAGASDEIVDYFTNPFEIDMRIKFNDGIKRTNRFIFPYISEMLDVMINNKHSFIEIALKKCIQYNKETYEKLKKMIESSIENYGLHFRKTDVEGVLNDLDFNENGNLVSFRGVAAGTGIVTNIVRTDSKSKDIKIKFLIDELNEYYGKIVNIRDEYIVEEK